MLAIPTEDPTAEIFDAFIKAILQDLQTRFPLRSWSQTGRTIIMGLSPSNPQHDRTNTVFIRINGPHWIYPPGWQCTPPDAAPVASCYVTLSVGDADDMTRNVCVNDPHKISDMILEKMARIKNRALRLISLVSSFGVHFEHHNEDASPKNITSQDESTHVQ